MELGVFLLYLSTLNVFQFSFLLFFLALFSNETIRGYVGLKTASVPQSLDPYGSY